MVKKREEENFFREEYKKSFNYIMESKEFIYSIILIFFIFAFIGFLFPVPEVFNEKILEFIREVMKKTEGLSSLELTRFIFLNNLESSFFGMIGGFFFGIFSVAVSAVNGYILGFVSSMVIAETGFSSLWTLFPHGIFELPAIFISLGLGIKLGSFVFQKKKLSSFNNYFWNSLRVFIFVIIPLLIIAAIIEGTLIVLLGG